MRMSDRPAQRAAGERSGVSRCVWPRSGACSLARFPPPSSPTVAPPEPNSLRSTRLYHLRMATRLSFSPWALVSWALLFLSSCWVADRSFWEGRRQQKGVQQRGIGWVLPQLSKRGWSMAGAPRRLLFLCWPANSSERYSRGGGRGKGRESAEGRSSACASCALVAPISLYMRRSCNKKRHMLSKLT